MRSRIVWIPSLPEQRLGSTHIGPNESARRKADSLSVYHGAPTYIPPLSKSVWQSARDILRDTDLIQRLRDSFYHDLTLTLLNRFSLDVGGVFIKFDYLWSNCIKPEIEGVIGDDDTDGFTPLDQLMLAHSNLFRDIINEIAIFPTDFSEGHASSLRTKCRYFLNRAAKERSIYSTQPPNSEIMDLMWPIMDAKEDWRDSRYLNHPEMSLKLFRHDEVRSPGSDIDPTRLYLGIIRNSLLKEIEAQASFKIKRQQVSGLFDNLIAEVDFITCLRRNRETILARELRWMLYVSRDCAKYTLDYFKLDYKDYSPREDIVDPKTIINSSADDVERARMLDQYVKEHPGEPISSIVIDAFIKPKELDRVRSSVSTSMPPPVVAPELYQGLRGPETPPAFITRVYGKWLGEGLTIADLRRIDPSLVRSFTYYRQSGGSIPDNFDLPAGKPGAKPSEPSDTTDRTQVEQGAIRTYWRDKRAQERARRAERDAQEKPRT